MKKNSNPPLRLLNVCRVSSNEQSEGYSLEAQSQANQEWATRKGYVIIDTIQYVETASKQKERKRFREIINRIRRGDNNRWSGIPQSRPGLSEPY